MSRMSCSLSGAAIGAMIGLSRSPLLKCLSWVQMKRSFWPASLGYWASAELPSRPWQAAQAPALVAPDLASPKVAGFSGASAATGAGAASGAARTVAACGAAPGSETGCGGATVALEAGLAAGWASAEVTSKAAATPRMRVNFMDHSGKDDR